MNISRRELARLASAAVATSGIALVAGAGTAAAQTPEVATREASANATFLDLLTYIPLSLVSENYTDGFDLATFGDGALRLSSVGVALPDSTGTQDEVQEIFRATMPVPYGDLVTATVRADDALALFGWSTVDVHQSLYSRGEDGPVQVLRGSFDPARLEAVWTANGYQMLDVEGQAVASLSAERDLDPSTELGRLTLGGANNAAILADGTLLYSGTLVGLSAMSQAHSGDLPSLGADPLVESTVSAITDPLSGAMLLPGPAFVAPPPFLVGEGADLQLGDLPEPGPIPLMGVVGFVSGSSVPESDLTDVDTEPVPSGSKMVAALHFLTAEEAAIAARRSLLTLETGMSITSGRPFAEYFPGWRVDHHAGGDTLTIEVDLFGNEAIWVQMIYSRDAGFLYS